MISIYKITNTLNGKCYIGQAKDAQRRWQKHCSPKSGCKKICRAIQKYGKESFTFEVLFVCDPEVADINETIQIARHNSVENGYNICPQGGSRRGVKLSSETKKKLSDAKKNMSDETKKKISDAMKGKSLSEEHKQRMSAAKKGENNLS